MDRIVLEIKKSISEGLPGELSHSKMAPLRPGVRSDAFKANTFPKPSAVMILLWIENNELYTCLTLRNTYIGAHSAQISLPGGKAEITDSNLSETALRETKEEIGIQNIKIISSLSEVYIPPSGFLVTPYIGHINSIPQFKQDPIEVAEIFKIPIMELTDSTKIKTKKMPLGPDQLKMQVPYFELHGQVVWGATAMILSEFKDIVQRTNIY